MKQTESAPMQLLRQVWDHRQEATGHSWLKLNHAMHSALFLALRAGMEFDRDDLNKMSRESRDGGFRWGYWCGDLEYFYREAVLYRNASAWQAFEAYRGRKPFIWEAAHVRTNTGDGPCGSGLERVVIGAEFVWNGEQVTVTKILRNRKGTVHETCPKPAESAA